MVNMAARGDSESDMPTGRTCHDCGGGPVVLSLGDLPLCDSCYDVRIAEATGWPGLPDPPPPETISGPDGREHVITYRVWRSPAGIAVEAAEGGRPFEGYAAEVVETHEADVAALVDKARAAIRRRIARQDLERSPSGNMVMAGFDLCGRLEWQDGGPPYAVVVDGRMMSWEEFGLAMEPYEGWEFRISFREGVVDDEEPSPDPDEALPFLDPPAPDERLH